MATQGTAQPILSVLKTGFMGIAVVLLLAGLCIFPFNYHQFTGWVGIAFMCATPTQVILSLLWQNKLPNLIGSLPQPQKGFALTAVTIVMGALFTIILSTLVGQGFGDTPMFIQYIILSVVVTLWLVPIWHCWPLTLLSKNPQIFGVLALFTVYLISYAAWLVFFNYTALTHIPTPQGEIVHPMYHSELDPQGLFDSWLALTFAVTTAGLIVVHSLLDFWPIKKLTFGKGQPIFGIVASVYILLLAYFIRWFFVDYIGMEQVSYMIQVPVSLLFGSFLVNNMMQFSLFTNMIQPIRGLVLFVCALIAGLLMFQLYSVASTWFSGYELMSGPSHGWQLELWIATAMLGITFPLIFVVSGYFDFWLLKPKNNEN